MTELSDLDAKRDRLAQLLDAELAEHGGETALTLDQRRLWFLRQLSPALPTHVVRALAVDGDLDPAVLQSVVNDMVSRHEILRTNVAEVDGVAVPLTAGSSWLPVRTLDLRGVPVDAADGELRRHVETESRTPFELGSGLLLRVSLVRTGDMKAPDPRRRAADRHLILVVMHQLVADERTVELLLDELAVRYHERATGEAADRGRPIHDFAEAVVQERLLLASPRAGDEREHWRAELVGAEPLKLVTDLPRPAVRTGRGRGDAPGRRRGTGGRRGRVRRGPPGLAPRRRARRLHGAARPARPDRRRARRRQRHPAHRPGLAARAGTAHQPGRGPHRDRGAGHLRRSRAARAGHPRHR